MQHVNWKAFCFLLSLTSCFWKGAIQIHFLLLFLLYTCSGVKIEYLLQKCNVSWSLGHIPSVYSRHTYIGELGNDWTTVALQINTRTSRKLVSLSTGRSGGGELSANPLLLPYARSSSTDSPLSLMRRRRVRVLWRGTLKTGFGKI